MPLAVLGHAKREFLFLVVYIDTALETQVLLEWWQGMLNHHSNIQTTLQRYFNFYHDQSHGTHHEDKFSRDIRTYRYFSHL